VRHSALHGAVGPEAIIVDDILDTGGTLVSACEALQAAGARELIVMATHGLFTGTAWQRLWSLGVRRIYVTDSTPLPESLSGLDRIVVLSVAPLLSEALDTLKT
jgi:ribose-phosphate pyrophosphokinase